MTPENTEDTASELSNIIASVIFVGGLSILGAGFATLGIQLLFYFLITPLYSIPMFSTLKLLMANIGLADIIIAAKVWGNV